jgi:hypothetical protein
VGVLGRPTKKAEAKTWIRRQNWKVELEALFERKAGWKEKKAGSKIRPSRMNSGLKEKPYQNFISKGCPKGVFKDHLLFFVNTTITALGGRSKLFGA